MFCRKQYFKSFYSYKSKARYVGQISSGDELPSLSELRMIYGSQTGTGASYAHMLGKRCRKNGIPSKLEDFSEFEYENNLLNLKYVILILSCFGEGVPSTSATPFYEWLMNEDRMKNKEAFEKLHYSIFGLGNSEYGGERYQRVAKTVDARLQALGATRVMDVGMGDDHHDSEETFEEWSNDLWNNIVRKNFAEKKKEVKNENSIEILNVDQLEKHFYNPYKNVNTAVYNQNNPFPSTVLVNNDLYNPKFHRRAKHTEFSIAGSGMTYETGDYVAVWPMNDSDVVEEVAEALSINSFIDKSFTSYDPTLVQKFPPFLTNPITIREFLTSHCDLTSPPSKLILSWIGKFAQNPDERDVLSSESLNLLDQKAFEAKYFDKSFGTILKELPSVKLSFQNFIEIVNPQRLKYYSISSSSSVTPDIIHTTTMRKSLPGRTYDHVGPNHAFHHKTDLYCKYSICANYIQNLKAGDKCYIHTVKSEYKLPLDPNTPIILIAVGTGLAPMIGFLIEREYQQAKNNTLFFGCYHHDMDFIYREQLEDLVSRGYLDLNVAFSHDQEQRIFVQQKMTERRKELWHLIAHQNAHIFICGNLFMGSSVRQTILQIIKEEGNFSEDESIGYLNNLSNNGRYKTDLFA